MTEKKSGTAASEEAMQEKTGQFMVEGVDDLIEQALAAVDKSSSKKAKAAVSTPVSEEPEDDGITWEEPEATSEGEVDFVDTTQEHSKDDARVVELEVALKEAQEALEKETAERQKVYETYVRQTAEYENFRKRTAREKDELKRFGHKDAMLDLLDVIDGFDRALPTLENAEESVREGIEMVFKQFLGYLQKQGVSRFASKGEPFDYTKHQAISMFETNDSPPQMVHEAFKEGYMFHEQLLRPAMVVVTKAPAAPAPAAQEAASDEDVPEEAAPQESDSEATS